MGTLRVFLFLLLFHSFHTAFAAVPKQYSSNSTDQGGRQDLTAPVHPQYANLIAEKQSAPTVIGYDPDSRPLARPDMPGATFSGDCRHTLILQYLRNNRDVPLKLRSHHIALTFHSFP